MTPKYKICPKCHTPAQVTDGTCGRCGHIFRTQFQPVPRPPTTPIYPLASVAPPRHKLRVYIKPLLAGSVGLVLLIYTVIHLARHQHPLVGEWRESTIYASGNTESLTFLPDGRYLSNSTWNPEGKWYST